MSWFNNLKIQVKLLFGFGAVLAVLGVIVVTNLMLSRSVADKSNTIVTHLVPAASAAADIVTWVRSADDDGAWYIMTEDPKQAASLMATYRDDLKKVDAAVSRAKELATTPEQLAALADFETFFHGKGGYVEANDEAFAMKDAGRAEEARAAYVSIPFLPSLTAAQTYIDIVDAEIERSTESVGAQQRLSQQLGIGLGIFAVVVGVGIGFFISRRIKNDVALVQSRMTSIEENCLTALQAGIQGVEQGDLTIDAQSTTAKIENPTRDELGQMAVGINRMLDKLVGTIASYNAMRNGLGQIIGGVRQNANSILDSSNALRESSDQMASATGQIATAINEVTRSAVSLAGLSQDSAREIERVAAGSEELAATAASSAGNVKALCESTIPAHV